MTTRTSAAVERELDGQGRWEAPQAAGRAAHQRTSIGTVRRAPLP